MPKVEHPPQHQTTLSTDQAPDRRTGTWPVPNVATPYAGPPGNQGS
ncbi:hypothetical protein [Kribbella catacumbae]|nr:hypothetical protein [Kribbella catacumbae]